jgi:DNA primase
MLCQAFILHRRAYTLHSELRAAERALVDEESEASLAWLAEIRAQLTSLEGASADRDTASAGSGLFGMAAGQAPGPGRRS